ncbi:MAG: efflux RND transporter periplasmic adaptor subunit [Bacteroidales bacterium]|nr:efflux RND transporter periplasmic adaptor subunit [Bacteroidales bacterium]MCF8337505.1 efflux RND transporter periplasmic adaptor subunit [Bacteroidales bacterium]
MKNKLSYFLVIFLFMVSCQGPEKEEEKDRSVKINVHEVNYQPYSFPVHTSGKLVSETESKLSFKTGGIIANIFVEEGESVSKGQTLAALNLSEIKARKRQAKLALEKARRDYRRAKNLYQDTVATKEDFQNARTALEVAKSDYEIAQFNLKHSSIKAPAKGKILKKLSSVNEMVAPGYPVFLFGSTATEWVVKINVTDKDILKIRENDSARVQFDAYDQKTFPGKVSRISQSADPYTGTFEVDIKLQNPEIPLTQGLIASTDIYPEQSRKLAALPIEALIEASGKTGFMYVYSEGNIDRRKISIHRIVEDTLMIEGGVNEEERVVTSGVSYINEETKVRLTN